MDRLTAADAKDQLQLPLTGTNNAEAVALQMAAARLSPAASSSVHVNPGFPNTYLGFKGDDVLSAAPPPPKPSRGSFQPPPAKPAPRDVPASVIAAAAAIGQAIASGHSTAALASTRATGSSASSSAGAGASGSLAASSSSSAAARIAAQPAVLSAAHHASSTPSANGGTSVWTTGPVGAKAESRLYVDLPESEFTYIERPWSHFLSRWAAIDLELERVFVEAEFTIIDLGSCNGFFALQAATGFPRSLVVGIEGSVGIGNGQTGLTGNQDSILETKAIQTHLRWIQRLHLSNCLLSPDVWDYRRVCSLASLKRPISHVMFLLSVVHHIDNVSSEQYTAAGLSRVEGSVSLMAKLLELAPRHFVELPDRPWMDHVYNAFGTARAFLDAAAKATGQTWTFKGPICISEWYGRRELWLMESEQALQIPVLPRTSFKAIFPTLLPQTPPSLAARAADDLRAHAVQAPLVSRPAFGNTVHSQAELGAALLAAPTALIAAHLQLRDAIASAELLLKETPSTALPTALERGQF